jgi:hypothetical protein
MAQATPTHIRVLQKAREFMSAVPEGRRNRKTRHTYLKIFRIMYKEGVFDPLRPQDAYDTYCKRRSALRYGGRYVIDQIRQKLEQMLDSADPALVDRVARELDGLIKSVAAAVIRDGGVGGASDGEGSASARWRAVSEDRARRGAGSKRYVLPTLPDDWRDKIWVQVPANSSHRSALAVIDVTGCRTADLVAGDRCGFAYAGAVACFEEDELVIYICPAKTDELVVTRYVVDVEGCGAVAHDLVAQCRASGGWMTIAIQSSDAVRKAVERLGQSVFPDREEAITPYVYRAQAIADAKAQWGAGEMVAIMTNQKNDTNQSRYGRYEHATGRRALKAVSTTREIKIGRVAHARVLGELRKASVANPHR